MTTRKKTKDQKKADRRRVFLVVVDDSKELHQALYFACKRAYLLMASVIALHWSGGIPALIGVVSRWLKKPAKKRNNCSARIANGCMN